jgi:L-aminopeptidase/D-esterase-like protein
MPRRLPVEMVAATATRLLAAAPYRPAASHCVAREPFWNTASVRPASGAVLLDGRLKAACRRRCAIVARTALCCALVTCGQSAGGDAAFVLASQDVATTAGSRSRDFCANRLICLDVSVETNCAYCERPRLSPT